MPPMEGRFCLFPTHFEEAMDIQPSSQKKQWDPPSVTSIGSIEQLTGWHGWWRFFNGGGKGGKDYGS